MGDHLPVAWDMDAPQVVHPQVEARFGTHGVHDEVSRDGARGSAMASRQNVNADTPPAAAHETDGVAAVLHHDTVEGVQTARQVAVHESLGEL